MLEMLSDLTVNLKIRQSADYKYSYSPRRIMRINRRKSYRQAM